MDIVPLACEDGWHDADSFLLKLALQIFGDQSAHTATDQRPVADWSLSHPRTVDDQLPIDPSKVARFQSQSVDEASCR